MKDENTVSLSDRHAYLIMCHGKFELLYLLLTAIDDVRNDIYIHVDKKTADVPYNRIKSAVCRSRVFFVDRIDVNWGGFSQIHAVFLLLQEATKTPHAYYHLISGVDFPLKSQDEIHAFFSQNDGKQFIAFDNRDGVTADIIDRIKYYYRFQDRIGRNRGTQIALLSALQRTSLRLQKLFGVNRLDQFPYTVRKGANWFSITHDLAVFFLSQESVVKKAFRNTLCGDEVVFQSLAFSSPYQSSIAYENMRYIDWKRGNPYTFTSADYAELTECGQLFARKFDDADIEVVKKLLSRVQQGRP